MMRVIGLSLALWLGSVLALAAETGYFPAGVWGPPEGAWTVGEDAQFYERWFGDPLRAMHEGQL